MKTIIVILLFVVTSVTYSQVSFQDIGNSRLIDTNGRLYVIPKPGKTLGSFNVIKPLIADSSFVVRGNSTFYGKIVGDINITGDFLVNDVPLTTSTDTSLLLHKYDSLRFPLRLWSINGHYLSGSFSITKSDLGIDTTNYFIKSLDNTLTGLNTFSGYKNTFKSIYLTSGGRDTIGTTDNYALHFKTNNTSRWYIDSLGQLSSNGANVISFSPITGYFSAAGFFMGSCKFTFGSASPESSTNAWKGSLYIRSGGDIGTTGYLKETPTGSASTTGWNPIQTSKADTVSTYSATVSVSMLGTVKTVTPTQTCTFNASGGVAGSMFTFYITSNGTSYTITFGTNFKSTGTIASGTGTQVSTITFICKDGTTWAETSRATGM